MWRVARQVLPFVGLALGITGCDQVSKLQAVACLTDALSTHEVGAAGLGGRLEQLTIVRHPRSTSTATVLDGFWRLRYVENPGAMWSLLPDLPETLRRNLLLVLSAGVMLFLLAWLGRLRARGSTALALALVLGGALGNFIDRARLGYVVDFIQWHWHDQLYWPVFNMADAAISCGVALLLLQQLLAHRRQSTALGR
jgi:signal peptidase II